MELSRHEKLIFKGLDTTEIVKLKLKALHAGVKPVDVIKSMGNIVAADIGLKPITADTVEQERVLIKLIYGI